MSANGAVAKSRTPKASGRRARVGFLGRGDEQRSRRKVRPKSRSRSLITLAALLVVGFGFAVAWLVSSAGDKVSVLVVGTDVPQGQVVEREVLRTQSVSGVPNAIPVDQIDSVVGHTAAVGLVEGTILTPGMVTAAPTPGPGHAVVGLSLDPTRVPSSGLNAGDRVDVIAVPGGEQAATPNEISLDTPTVLTSGATVHAVEGLATDGGQVLVTVVVDEADASRVAAHSASGLVAVIEVTAGER